MNAIEKEKIKEKLAEEIVETKQKVSKYKELTQCNYFKFNWEEKK